MEQGSDIEEIPSGGGPSTEPPPVGSVFRNVSAPPRIVQQKIYVSFSAEINPNTTESLIALLCQQINLGIQEVCLLLSTPGGNVMNGLNLYNILRSFPVRLTTHNVGNVDSIGNAIFLAGQERYACPHSTFMFHGVGFDIPGHVRLEEKLLRERLQSILADQNRIGSIIGERTRLKNRQIKNLFKEARTKDANYARSVGIIDDIREAAIPSGAPVFSLVFQR
ncbi:MAG: ATP-dependent Clp protease proteolytic subunit [Beijerinckiaceae bacterium]|nr:ATP-dependent Clp protease proteolytic subunit [Beijerinckiaceae bacterium]